MFTVKATYRNETRKFSFPDSSFFPTYDQLYHQLYRVFPISHNYYLSKLLFSPNSSEPSRILIGREVHSADEYSACLAPFQGRAWRNALLRFSIFDQTPHKIPCSDRFLPGVDPLHTDANSRDDTVLPSPRCGFPDLRTPSHSAAYQPPVSMFHIPPPPIIYSSSHFTPPLAPMDIDVKPASCQSSFSDKACRPHQSPHAQQEPQHNKFPCCSVSQGKLEIMSALTNFKDDIDRIITKHFETSTSSNNAFWLPCQSTQSSNMASVVSPRRDLPAPPTLPPWRQPLCSFTTQVSPPVWTTNVGDVTAHGRTGKPTEPLSQMMGYQRSDVTSPVGPYIPPDSPIGPYIPPDSICGSARTTESVLPSLRSTPIFPRIRTPLNTSTMEAVPVPAQPVSSPPLVHVGVSCDVCRNTIVGVRQKCLDCPDYDLCQACMNTGAAERHNPFHEFFGIEEPGRVVVHTVFSGDGERDALGPSGRQANRTANLPVRDEQRTHHAACDLCDSTITGTRYKCLDCPDFDTCALCFSITNEQHPNHSFVKITNPDDLLSRSELVPTRHYATCDGCHKGIIGVRYKCMHPDCPDFDLCSVCEAHPIPIHPPNHPMLKMKSVNTVVPTVYRVGQTTLINDEEAERQFGRRGRSPSREVRSPPHSVSPVRSYSRGYLHNPSAESRSRSPSNVHSRHSPPPLQHLPVFRSYSPAPVIIPQDTRHSRSPIYIDSFTVRSESRSRSPICRRHARSRSPRRVSYYDSSRSRSPPRTPGIECHMEASHFRQPSPPQSTSYRRRSPSRPSPPRGNPDSVRQLYRSPSPTYLRSHSPIRRYRSPSPPRRYTRSPLTPPSTRRVAPPTGVENEPALIRFEEPESQSELHELETERHAHGNSVPQGKTVTQSSRSSTSLASSTSGSASASQFKLPPLAPPMDLFREFWPRVAQELRHLMQESVSSQDATQDANVENVTQGMASQASTNTVVNSSMQTGSVIEPTESPLAGEALLKRPDDSSVQPDMLQLRVPVSLLALLNASSGEQQQATETSQQEPEVPPRAPSAQPEILQSSSLANTQVPSLLTSPRQPSLSTAVKDEDQPTAVPEAAPQVPQQTSEVALSAFLLGNNNVPDNQVFPPGAEFVKSWRMLNDGTKAWPETTVLELVVGESFSCDAQAVKVGSVARGAVIDLWTGELKAPESSGKYISYWRLNDGQGNMFGHCVWIDIVVAEQGRSEDSSLASSSIIMPQSAPAKSSMSSDIVIEGNAATPPSLIIASSSQTDDAASDNGSDGSSVSLISIPSSDDDDDPTIWEDSRSHAVRLSPPDRARAAMEYVVLYDDSSSDEA